MKRLQYNKAFGGGGCSTCTKADVCERVNGRCSKIVSCIVRFVVSQESGRGGGEGGG